MTTLDTQTMDATTFEMWLTTHNACSEAKTWLREQPQRDLAAIWSSCPRADWLLWLCRYATPKIPRKALVCAAVECAALALPYTTDPRVSACIDATRGWCEDTVSDDELRAKRAAANAANAAAAAAAAARAHLRARCADIVRRYIACPTLEAK